ncbi:MAG: BrnA antitoxin family protein [Acetobacteraceae bacterium]
MPQEEVERLADEEDGPLPEGWESTIEIGIPRPKQGVHIRLDADVLDWFRSHGPGYQTRINAVLRAFVRARQKAAEATSKG